VANLYYLSAGGLRYLWEAGWQLVGVVDFQRGVSGYSISDSIFCYAFVLGLITLRAHRFNAKKSASDGIFVN
jgi:hypothetical protein